MDQRDVSSGLAFGAIGAVFPVGGRDFEMGTAAAYRAWLLPRSGGLRRAAGRSSDCHSGSLERLPIRPDRRRNREGLVVSLAVVAK